MSRERIETTLRFVGEWPWWAGLALALFLACAAGLYYRREVRSRGRWLGLVLPTLRALAVALIVLMLSGPVLHHRKVIGELSKVWVFIDGSRSMGLGDPAMSIGRKVTMMQRLGLLSSDGLKSDLAKATESLADAQALAESARNPANQEETNFKKVAQDFRTKIQEVERQLASDQGDGRQRLELFKRELAAPASAIAERQFKQIGDRNQASEALVRLGAIARRWQEDLSTAFQKSVGSLAAAQDSPLHLALKKFDAMSRAQRIEAWLLHGDAPVLGKLAETHDIQLVWLDGAEGRKFWEPNVSNSTLPDQFPKPVAEITDLTTGVKSRVGEQGGQRSAVVLISDGQHNEGEGPLELARTFGGRQIPIFTVGVGSATRPRDLAIVKTEAPEAVFFQDRVRGQITLKDDMPAGMPFKVSIQEGDKTVWEKALTSDGTQLRKIPFEFAVQELIEAKLAATKNAVQLAGVPLELSVNVSQLEGDSEPANNSGTLRLRAVTQKRKILLVDGRPRWESRYLRNLFDRDEQWEVNAVVAGSKVGESGFARGSQSGQFPDTAALLNSYDLIIFGEVPRALWKGDELQWINEFAGQRGGAVIFVDGGRSRLQEYAQSALAPLFPVEWKNPPLSTGASKLLLTERGANLAPLSLAAEKAQNADVWGKLPAPHWISGATILPGAETLLEALFEGKKWPAIVARPFGAGKVLYHGFEDSWRWRFNVADQHHMRYWNQVANWIAELPFAVRDKFVSLDAGPVTYRPGETADVRVRLRDGEGKPVRNASIDAVLSRDGNRIATIRLAADENTGGLFHGRTSTLEPGDYEVSVESAAIPSSELKARTGFKVQPRATGEMTILNLNEELLTQVATLSGGQYIREENTAALVDLLAPMSQGKVIEIDTALWQSYWWFFAIVALLTLEWIIRKRSGLL